MKLLIISDGHGDLEKLKRIKPVADGVDAIIFGGDFAAFKKIETGAPFLNELLKIHKNIFAVLGNCDAPEFEKKLKDAGVSITGEVKNFEGLIFAGSGGGSKFTGTTPYERTDEELVKDLTDAFEKANITEAGNLVLVCHNPPHGAKVDKVAPMVHVGSKGITAFIEKHKPLLVVSGHIHESFAVDKIGETVLVNPGALMEGRYALAEITKNEKGFKVSVELKTLD